MDFNVFGVNVSVGRKKDSYIDSSNNGEDVSKEDIDSILESVVVDNTGMTLLESSKIVGIKESVVNKSAGDLKRLLDSDEIKLSTLMDALKADYNSYETYKENEDMAKDTIVGSAMELMADDCCMVEATTKKIVGISSESESLREFLENFLYNVVDIENRIWEWALEIVKHGDFKLRRREIKSSKSEVRSVFYENVQEGYKVSRVEYLGTVLGYLDETGDNVEYGHEMIPQFEDKDAFVHFLSSKLPSRKKIKIQIRDEDNELKEITCFKVHGVSLVDNARYIFRINSLMDNMLVMSRVARSTQYNIVKVEVGNAGPAKTQEILSDVRRRIEGSTKMSKGRGMKTDPSPIPINSNVYIPVREGKGDIIVDSVNENVDVRSIVDVDYFRNKEFATLKTPKAYLGFEEELPGSMGNNSLVRLDIRYARNVQKAHSILKNGIKELCCNYLKFRGRVDELDSFDVVMRSVTSAEDAARVEDFISRMSIFDSMNAMIEQYGEYLSKPDMLIYLFNLIGIDVSEVASKKMKKILKSMEDGTYIAGKGFGEDEEDEEDLMEDDEYKGDNVEKTKEPPGSGKDGSRTRNKRKWDDFNTIIES